MKKVILTLVLVLTLVFAFTSCGGGGESTSDSQGSGSTDVIKVGEGDVLMAVDEAEIKYVGIQKADPELTEGDNAYLVIFDFTNHSDDAAEVQNFFEIKYFQNGSELSTSVSYSSAAKEQYDLCSAFFSDALKDGTVRFGKIAPGTDDSPLTILVTEKNNPDNKVMAEVNLSDAAASDSSSGESSGEVSVSDIDAMLQGNWGLPENGMFHFENGETYITNGTDTYSGEYTINTDTSEIECILHADDSDLKVLLPYELKDGNLIVYNNRGEAIEHK